MLFPSARDERPRTAIALTDVDGALPVVSWLGVTAEADGPDGFVAGRQRAGHAAPGRARPRPVHARSPARPPVPAAARGPPGSASWSGRSMTVGSWCAPRTPGRAGPGLRARGGGRAARCGVAPRSPTPEPVSTSCTASRWCCRWPTTTSSCSTSPAATSVSEVPSGTRSTTVCGCARGSGPARARRGDHGRGRHGRLLHHARPGGRRPRRLERQLRAPRRADRRARRHDRRRRAPAARRGRAADRGVVQLALGVLRRRRRRPRRPGRALARLPALARRAPGSPARRAERVGGGVLRPRPRPAPGDRRPRGAGRGGAVRARRRLVPRPARRHRRARRLVRRRVGLARGARPADRARAVPRHGVRAVVRAGDGQPRLRPLSRSTPTGSSAAVAAASRCSTATSRSWT